MEFLRHKIEQGFVLFDSDRDEVLSEHDHVLIGRRTAEALRCQPGSAAETAIVDAFVVLWQHIHRPHVIRDDGNIGKAEFISATLAMSENRRLTRTTVGALAETVFQAADANRDGVMTLAEYTSFLQGAFPHADHSFSATAYGHLDRTGTGRLSCEDFVAAAIEYWTSEDPHAPGNWWAGQPVTQVVGVAHA